MFKNFERKLYNMERVQRTVEIKLTPEECEILWKAEQLLREMEKEISGITTPVYQSDKEEIAECLRVFGKITSRYDVHLTLGVDGERNEAEIVKAFGQAFDYLEKRPFDQNGDLLPGYEFEFLKFETDSGDYQYRSNDWEVRICMEKSIRLPEKLKELSPETGEESNAYLVTFMCGTTPCINLAIAKTKEKVKEYFANILNVKESDFISIRLATEDDKRPGIPVHHIPEYPYVLHIEYSWGDREPNQKFSTKEDAWKKAMSMAMTEADTASDEKEDGTAEIIMEKAKSEISLVYPKSAEENSFCRYYITKEKGE